MDTNIEEHASFKYVLVNFLIRSAEVLSERLLLSANEIEVVYLRPPQRAANQVLIRMNSNKKSELEIGMSDFLGGRRIPVKFCAKIISKQFALHCVTKQLKPYLSNTELGRLDEQLIWDMYYRCIAGELPRPLRSNDTIEAFYWERVCNYNQHSTEVASSRLRLYSGSTWLDSDGTKQGTVSIIIPVYGQIDHTTFCLLSIFEERRRNCHRDCIKIQVIIVDDCSPGIEEVECLKSLGKQGLIKLILKPENTGFIESCNTGAEAANGAVVIFLNNDVEVLDQWLEELIAPLENSDVGLTGSKLIYADGSLQEAGGIIWSNGNAWNYGRGSTDPYLPEYTYMREVDYISGASIAMRRKDFNEVGEFSREFKPAYCEDSDLALKIRYELGKKIIFNPFSQVVHYEGKSCGTDLQSGIKRYQIENTKRLFEKWKHILSENQLEDATDLFHARGRTSKQPTALIIDHYIPEPDRDAGSRTMYAFIKALRNLGCRIVFWPDNLYASPYCRKLQKLGVEVLYFTDKKCPDFEAWLSENSQYIDVALISRPLYMVKYGPTLKRYTNSPIVFYGHDLHHRRSKTEHSVKGIEDKSKELEELKQEKHAWSLASLILYPTIEETRIVGDHLGVNAKVKAIQAYTFETSSRSKQMLDLEKDHPGPFRLLFVGGFRHTPNVDAMIWFCQSIMPIIRSKVECILTIAGSNPSLEIQALEAEGITVTGFVSDDELERLYQNSDIAVVPLRYGAGIKGKVIEAFSRGIPVVTTRIGLQGIEWEHRLAYAGDSAEGFADAVFDAMRDITVHPDRSQCITQNALSFVKANYSDDSMVESWNEILNELLAQRNGIIPDVFVGNCAHAARSPQ